MTIDVSILVPVLNEAAHLRDTVRDMLAQRFDGDVELLVIDGGSTDGSQDILAAVAAADHRVRVLRNPRRSTPAALNVGLGQARGEFVARMDAHTFYPPTYIRDGVERLRAGDVEWVSGPAIARGVGRWSQRVALALGSRLGHGTSRKWQSGAAERTLDTGVFGGVWRRDVLDALGGWDEGWPINQDSELAARALARGHRLVCRAEMAAHYVPRDNPRALARQYFRYGFYRAKTAARHPTSARGIHALLPALTLIAAMALAGRGTPARRSRALLFGYACTVVCEGTRQAGDVREGAGVAAAFSTMHLAWGAGYWAGALRYAVPWAGGEAIRR